LRYANLWEQISWDHRMKEIYQVLRSKELELSQVEIEVQSLRIVAELLGEEADREEADREEARSRP
jgi:hypothetical protein